MLEQPKKKPATTEEAASGYSVLAILGGVFLAVTWGHWGSAAGCLLIAEGVCMALAVAFWGAFYVAGRHPARRAIERNKAIAKLETEAGVPLLYGEGRCRSCRRKLLLNAVACSYCGTLVAISLPVCEGCGTRNPEGSTFCAGCAQPLSPNTVQR